MGADRAVLGVDGCPGGWVGALVRGSTVTWHAGSFAALLEVPCDLVAVDIPIGLPDGGERRAADVAAKAALGAQRSSVFFTPPRAALAARTHSEATELSRAAGSVGVSIQTYGILHKIAEVDRCLGLPGVAERVVEVHPEVSFRRMCGRVLPPKRKAAGRQERLEVLRGWLPGLDLPRPRPGRAAADDCLDALAAAWSGARWLRGEAEVLGGGTDAAGHPARIVV